MMCADEVGDPPSIGALRGDSHRRSE